MTPRYPVNVDLRGRRCLVVGGGAVAERKVEDLLDAGAHVTVAAPTLTEQLATSARSGDIVHLDRTYEPSDMTSIAADGGSGTSGHWWIVVAATDDPAVNRAVAADGDRTATWVNVASAPDGGSVARPAVHHAGRVTLTVATGGVHPAAATWLRDLAATVIEPEHLALLDLLADLRVEDPGNRPSWRTVLDSGTLDLIREGRVAQAKERLEACLSSSSD